METASGTFADPLSERFLHLLEAFPGVESLDSNKHFLSHFQAE
jgi:hypothetical protein